MQDKDMRVHCIVNIEAEALMILVQYLLYHIESLSTPQIFGMPQIKYLSNEETFSVLQLNHITFAHRLPARSTIFKEKYLCFVAKIIIFFSLQKRHDFLVA